MTYISRKEITEFSSALKSTFTKSEGWKLSVVRKGTTEIRVRVLKSPIGLGFSRKKVDVYRMDTYNRSLQHVINQIRRLASESSFNAGTQNMSTEHPNYTYYLDIEIGSWYSSCKY
jgi:hypothetical protein